jgi:hypothetical protein
MLSADLFSPGLAPSEMELGSCTGSTESSYFFLCSRHSGNTVLHPNEGINAKQA